MNENGVAGEWEQENGERIQKIDVTCWERNWRRTGGFDSEGDSGWGYGQGPSGYNGGIDKQDTGSGSALDDGKNDMLGGNADEWTGGELVNYLRSTKTLLVGGHILRQTSGGRTRLRCWKMRREWRGR